MSMSRVKAPPIAATVGALPRIVRFEPQPRDLHLGALISMPTSRMAANADFDAGVSHELCHVRQRDSLGAALHMVVETSFWFHPLVWWIERRLVEERERACDERSARQGGEPEVELRTSWRIASRPD